VELREPLRQRHADAQPAAPAVIGPRTGTERLEDPRQVLAVHAEPGVPDSDGGGGSIRPLREGDRDAASRLGELDRVLQDVREDLGEPRGISADPERPIGQVRLEGQPRGFQGDPVIRDGAPDHFGEIDALSPEQDRPAGDARQVEEIVGDPGHMSHLALDDVAGLRRQVSVGIALEHVERALDGRERASDLVREDRQELILAAARLGELGFAQTQGIFHALPLLQLPFQALGQLLGPAARDLVGQVRDDQVRDSLHALHRVDGDVDRHHGAVGAKEPELALPASGIHDLGVGRLEGSGEEPVHRFPDDFVHRPLQHLGEPSITVENRPIRTRRDRPLLHLLDQNPIRSVGRLQRQDALPVRPGDDECIHPVVPDGLDQVLRLFQFLAQTLPCFLRGNVHGSLPVWVRTWATLIEHVRTPSVPE